MRSTCPTTRSSAPRSPAITNGAPGWRCRTPNPAPTRPERRRYRTGAGAWPRPILADTQSKWSPSYECYDDPMNVRAYRSPRREQAAADTRTAILDAAELLFAEHGYARTTVAQVAAAADVAANTVYTSIGGKPQLVVALTERGTDDPNITNSLQHIDAMTDGAVIIPRPPRRTAVTRRNECHTMAVMWDTMTSAALIAPAAE